MAADVPGFLAAMARRNLTATGGFDSGVAGFTAPAPDPMPAPQGPFVDDAANSDAYTPVAPQATPARPQNYTPQDLANAVAEWHAAAAMGPQSYDEGYQPPAPPTPLPTPTPGKFENAVLSDVSQAAQRMGHVGQYVGEGMLPTDTQRSIDAGVASLGPAGEALNALPSWVVGGGETGALRTATGIAGQLLLTHGADALPDNTPGVGVIRAAAPIVGGAIGAGFPGVESGAGYVKDVFDTLNRPGAVELRPGEGTMAASLVPGVGPSGGTPHPQLPEELAGPIRDALAGHAAYEDSGQLAEERQATLEQRIAAARQIAAAGGNPADALGGLTSADRPVLDLTPEQVDAAKALINRDAATNPRFFQPIEAVRALDLAAQGRPVPPSLRASLSKYVTPAEDATAPATGAGAGTERGSILAALKFAIQKEIADTGSLSAESRAALNDGLTPDEVRGLVGDESATAHAASQSSLFDTSEEAAARPAVPRKGPIEPIVGPTGYVDQPPLGGRTPPPEPSGTADLPNNEGGFPLHAESPAMPLEDELANFPKYDQPGDLPSGKSPADIRRALQQAWADGRQASGYGDTQPGTPGGFPLHSAQPALDVGDPLANFPKYDQPGDLPSGRTPEDIRRALQQAWMDGRDGTGLKNTADRGATQPPLMPPDATPLTAQAQRAYRSVASRIVTSPVDLINQGGRAMQFAFDFVSPIRLLHTAGSADLSLYGQMWAKVAKAAISNDVSEYVQRQWDATTSKPLITNRGTASQGEAYLKISDVFAPRSEGGYALPGTRINPDGLPSAHNGTDYGILSHLPGRVGQQINARLQILGLFQKMWGPEMLHMHLQNALDAGDIGPADLMNPATRADAGRSVSLLEGHSSIPASNLRPLGIFINTPDWLLSNFELVGRAMERGTLTGAAARTAITRVVAAGTAATYAINLAQGVKPNDPRMYRNHVPMIVMTKPVTDAIVAATDGKVQFKPDSQIDAYGTLGSDTQHVIGLGDAAITGAQRGGVGDAIGSTAKEGAYWAAGQASTVGRLGMLVSDQLVHSPKDTFGHPITPGSYAEPFKPIPFQQTNASSGAQIGGQLGVHIYEPPTPKSAGGVPRPSRPTQPQQPRPSRPVN